MRIRVCGCPVCSRLRKDDVTRVTRRNKDLTLLFGIGRTYAQLLEDGGVRTWEELLGCDAQEVVRQLKRRKCCVSAGQVERWKCHAESWRLRRPVYFGTEPCVKAPFIALDLEYSDLQSSPLIWLTGVGVVTPGETEFRLLWADDRDDELRNLRLLSDLLGANPSLPVVTWNGIGADVPRLRGVCQEHPELRDLARALGERHVDLYLFTQRALRLPVTSLSLKDVGAYFGIPRLSDVLNGLEAQLLWYRYREVSTPKTRAKLKDRLLDYNRDDLACLVGAAKAIHEISLDPTLQHAVSASTTGGVR